MIKTMMVFLILDKELSLTEYSDHSMMLREDLARNFRN